MEHQNLTCTSQLLFLKLIMGTFKQSPLFPFPSHSSDQHNFVFIVTSHSSLHKYFCTSKPHSLLIMGTFNPTHSPTFSVFLPSIMKALTPAASA